MLTSTSRTIAVGDIHGYLSSITRLIKNVQPTETDKFVFLGDYINNGPESRKVIDFLIEFKKTFPQSIFLKGNHEQMFLDYLSGENTLSFLANGGHTTLRAYTDSNTIEIPSAHRNFFENLKPYHEEETHVFVHAGLQPNVPIAENEINTMLWIRNEFIQSEYDWGKKVVFGHTPFESPLIEANKIGINCDIHNSGLVVCYEIETKKFWFSHP